MPKIKNITNRQNWLKLLLGQPITMGKTYAGVTFADGRDREGRALTALGFKDGMLILSGEDRRYFLCTAGDCAAWGREILADRASFSICFQEPLTGKTDFSAIRRKYHRVPTTVLRAIFAAVSESLTTKPENRKPGLQRPRLRRKGWQRKLRFYSVSITSKECPRGKRMSNPTCLLTLGGFFVYGARRGTWGWFRQNAVAQSL